MKKKPYISNKMQEVAVDILTRIMFVSDLAELGEIFEYAYNKYELHDDPFTHTPCSDKEYHRLLDEYSRQKALEIYGYCDWF